MNVQVLANTHDELGEGLLWSPDDGAVYWVDIMLPTVRRMILATGRVTSWPMPETIGWLVRRTGRDDFIAGLASGFAELSLAPLQISLIGAPEPKLTNNRMNDATVDRDGRIWAGTMDVDAAGPSGSLYCMGADKTWTCHDTGYLVSNGPAISRDQDWLYHTDSLARSIYRFAMHDDGTLGPRELHITFEDAWGLPDGMTCDNEGGLWIAHWGGGRVSRFTPEGVLERSIALPVTNVTNLVFAGPALDRLIITSAASDVEEELAGALFEADPRVIGIPPYKFDG